MDTSTSSRKETAPEYAWRAPAPRARLAAAAIFAWSGPRLAFAIALSVAVLFAAAAALSPALLSLSPTANMIGPIAEARAVLAGEAALVNHEAPLFVLLLAAADMFADVPGRVHLVAKAMSAVLIAAPFAYLAAPRFPALYTVLIVAGLSAYAAAPFSGPAELGLAVLMVTAMSLLSVSAEESKFRARFEGALGGCGLAALWLLNPVYAFAGLLALSACPFVAGRFGLQRYAGALALFVILAIAAELLAPGMNAARALAASHALKWDAVIAGGEAALALSGGAHGALLVIFSALIFGGRAHRCNGAAALGLVLVGLIAARLAGANALPVFALAAGLACFSVASPFYDGLFSGHDRASVATALTAAGVTLFWTGAIAVQATGQFSLQYAAAKDAPADIRAELALVQPGGPTIAKWIEEGRFSTPEARELLALAPVDQSAMLLEAAGRARTMAEQGYDVAILTAADTACVLAKKRDCRADGPAAASAANIVFVPRLEMDAKSVEAKGRAEALLFTQFKMVERTPLWDIWMRRDISAPASLNQEGDETGMYR